MLVGKDLGSIRGRDNASCQTVDTGIPYRTMPIVLARTRTSASGTPMTNGRRKGNWQTGQKRVVSAAESRSQYAERSPRTMLAKDRTKRRVLTRSDARAAEEMRAGKKAAALHSVAARGTLLHSAG